VVFTDDHVAGAFTTLGLPPQRAEELISAELADLRSRRQA
jgi:hypothetical protein